MPDAARPPDPAEAERQVQELLMHGESLQAEARAIDEQRSVLESLARDLRRGRDALAALRGAQAGDDVLLPVGGGTFVKAKLADSAKVLSGLGAGVVVESAVPDALARLEERLTGTEQALQRAAEELRRVEQEMARLNTHLTRMTGG